MFEYQGMSSTDDILSFITALFSPILIHPLLEIISAADLWASHTGEWCSKCQ